MTTPAFPTGIQINGFRLDLNENKASTESLFTRGRQLISLGAGTSDRWEGMIQTPILTEANSRKLFAFLASVGLYGEFTIVPPDYAGPASGATSGSVNGASQTGTTLDVDGLATSSTIALAGDYFQVRDQFKMLTQDATTNSSGQVTLHFVPALRVSPTDNDPVDFATPEILCELTSAPSLGMQVMGRAQFTLTFRESLNNT